MVGADNRTASDGTWNYFYDNEGNLVSKTRIGASEEWDYQYDHRNLMTRAQQWVSGQLQQTVDYAYDVLGRRIQRHASDILGGNSTERYGYNGDNVLLDLTGGNALTMRRLYGGGSDEVLSRESAAGALTWYLSDYQGSVIGLAAAAGGLIGVTSYDGFGNIQSDTTGTSGDRYRWTGREMDFATGEQFNRARYYDPALGKWTTQDPEGFAAGDWDLYRYVGNGATDGVDPSGMEFTSIVERKAYWKKTFDNLNIEVTPSEKNGLIHYQLDTDRKKVDKILGELASDSGELRSLERKYQSLGDQLRIVSNPLLSNAEEAEGLRNLGVDPTKWSSPRKVDTGLRVFL